MSPKKPLKKSDKESRSSISFRLISINILSFSIKNEDVPKKKLEFVFELGIQTKTDLKKNIMEILTFIKVFSDKSKKIEMGEIRTSNSFLIENMKDVIIIESGKEKIPEMLLASLVGISISNTRGILFARAAGTILANAIVPVINPTELIRSGQKDK